APPCENEEEIITDVTLTFTPVDGGDPVIATANDPDGSGPLDLQVDGDINLVESTEYTLTMELLNSIEGEDITEEIMEEDEEHMFFFAFNDEVFTSPAGDGNVDNRDDMVNYNDFDSNGLPVGLSTDWTTECVEDMNLSGMFQVILKHQPGVKSATSTVNDGGTDVDLTWNINVVDDPNAPPCENEEEIITDVTLTFTPVDGGDPVTATAVDPDGAGPMDLEVSGEINLVENTEYTLTIELLNSIEDEDITEEIMEEDDEHMFFFAWSEGLFTDPMGDGNADNRADAVNYNDFDENNQPVGLSTDWTTSAGIMNDTLSIVLKHQPGIKSATSTIDDGGTDIDLTWNVNTVLTSTNNIQVNTTDLRVSPNPVRNILQWRIDDLPTNEGELRIVDQFGRIISVNRNPQPTLNVSHLPKGMYTLQVRSEDKIWTQRFVKL
ncbi:T9SS type A sorting domain-containing protein, partial [Candidatus Uhrbacteria bacterium]|nr:T9SS type A sorting domain-containing protein [Candidatus Uhrbacteria bacterium]